jgi:hypothetical protein
MSADVVRDPMADAGYRSAVRRAATQGISLSAIHHGDRWTVVGTHTPTGGIAETAASLLALAAWQALEQLRPTVEAERERERAQPRPVAAQRPGPRRILVPVELVIEAYDLLLACDESGDPPDEHRVRAVVGGLRPIIIKAAR